MSIDFLSTIQSDSDRLVAALAAAPDAAIPWCGDWTVKDCARHVGGFHHVIAQVIEGRPTANFGLFKQLHPPKADDPALGTWLSEGTSHALEQMRAADWSEPAWTFRPDHPTVAFWPRRVAHETAVHRWDVETAAGTAVAPMERELAADGVDEYLDVFLAMLRPGGPAPGAGETAHLHCTDTEGEWFVVFPAPGERILTREHAKGDVAFRGPAQGLLLFLWNRLPAAAAGVEVIGDTALAARWPELAPSV